MKGMKIYRFVKVCYILYLQIFNIKKLMNLKHLMDD